LAALMRSWTLVMKDSLIFYDLLEGSSDTGCTSSKPFGQKAILFKRHLGISIGYLIHLLLIVMYLSSHR
jgi:hypothetical protein